MEFEDLSPEEKAKAWEMYQKEKKVELKKRPVSTEWLPLGENYGVNIAIWDNGVTLTKRKKVDNEWQDTEKFNLSKKVMTELFVRIPSWFTTISKEEE